MLHPRTALVPLLGTASLIAGTSTAHAATYCVGSPPPGTVCDNTYPATGTGVVNATNAAALSAVTDTIHIGAGTIASVPAIVIGGSGGDHLVGAGQSATVLQFSGTSGDLVQVGNGTSAASLSDLTLESSAFTANGSTVRVQATARAERLRVRELTPANPATVAAVRLATGATLSNATVETDSANDEGVTDTYGPATIDTVRISGDGTGYAGIHYSANPSSSSVAERVHISGFQRGVSIDTGTFSIADSVIDLGDTPGATGIYAKNDNNGNLALNFGVARSTIVGTGSPQWGIIAAADSPAEAVYLTMRDSLVRLTGSPTTMDLLCTSSNGGSASMDRVNVGYGTKTATAPYCPWSAVADFDLYTHPPRFVNAAAGDYRPAWDSPVIDRGTSATFGSTADLFGDARLVDGDGNGSALLDLGAAEYQRQAPAAATASFPAGGAAPGAELAFAATAGADPDGDPTSIAWDFGDGTSATGPATSHTYATPGTYLASVRTTDATGLTSAPVTTTVTVAEPQAPATPTPTPLATVLPVSTPTPAAGAPAAAATPTVRIRRAPRASVTRSRRGFQSLAKAASSRASIATTGATSLRLTATRLVRGRKVGSRCRSTARRGARCTVRVAAKGHATVAITGSTTYLGFGGTLARHRLPRGTYEITVVALSATGARSAKATYRVVLR